MSELTKQIQALIAEKQYPAGYDNAIDVSDLQALAAKLDKEYVLVPRENIPNTCNGKEQEAFESYAINKKMDMNRHPLHYLFLNKETSTARDSWREAIQYCKAMINTGEG